MLDEVARLDIRLEFVNKFLQMCQSVQGPITAAACLGCGVFFCSVTNDPEYVIPEGTVSERHWVHQHYKAQVESYLVATVESPLSGAVAYSFTR
jgi:hypothetical protein